MKTNARSARSASIIYFIDMRAIILCAGEGTRLRPLTLHRPKPLFPVLCVPLLERILGNLADHGIFRATANVWYRRQDFMDFVADYRGETLFSLVPEDELLGTGGGIANVAANIDIDDTFIVHTGDIFCDIDFTSAIREHRASGAELTFLVRRGAKEIFAHSDKVIDINGEIGITGDSAWKFTGISIWEPEMLDYMPRPGSPGGAVNGWIRAIRKNPGTIRIHDIGDAMWADIGTPRDYVELHKTLLGGGNSVAKGVDLPAGVNLRGNACICPGAEIGAGSSLNDVVIWPGGKIQSGTSLDGAIVGPFGIHRL